MNIIYRIIIIEDHPLIADAYKNALKSFFSETREEYMIFEFKDIDSVLNAIRDKNFLEDIDMVFLDINLPYTENSQIKSGEDLGIKLKQVRPNLKILVSTTFNDNYRIQSILKSLDPDGMLIKNDLDKDQLLLAIKAQLDSSPFYSKTVLKMLRKQINADLLLDANDRLLLYELSIGTKLKELPNILPLSLGGGYNGSNCASDFGRLVPGISV